MDTIYTGSYSDNITIMYAIIRVQVDKLKPYTDDHLEFLHDMYDNSTHHYILPNDQFTNSPFSVSVSSLNYSQTTFICPKCVYTIYYIYIISSLQPE